MSSTPAETIRAYVLAFATQRVEAIAPFYLLPCTFVRPEGVWIVQDDDAAVTLVRQLLDHAVSQGYRSTRIREMASRQLAPTLAEVSGTFERIDAFGASIGCFGFTYVLRKSTGPWRIIVAVAHEAAAAAMSPTADFEGCEHVLGVAK